MLISITEAVEKYGVSREKVRSLCAGNWIPAIKSGKPAMWYLNDVYLEDFLGVDSTHDDNDQASV